MVLLVAMAVLAQGSGGCTKDTDCKGDRICEAGVCVTPPSAPQLEAPPVPPPPPPQEAAESYPRVVRRDGQVCVQSLGATGQVEESCRMERKPLGEGGTVAPREDSYTPAPSRRSRRGAPQEAQQGGFSADVLFGGGLMALLAGDISLAMPEVTGYLALGGRGASGVGFVGVLNAAIGLLPGANVFAVSVAPGLRIGAASHVVLSLGPTFLAFAGGGRSISGIAGTAILQGVISLHRGLVISPQAGFTFDLSGVVLTLGVGIGFSTL